MDRSKDIYSLHLNTAKSWRGGEKQTYYLILKLHERGYKTCCICQKNSILQERLEEKDIPCFPIKMRSEIDLIAAARIAKIAKEFNADILHMHTSHAHSLGLLSNLFYKIPVNIVSRRVDFRISGHFLNRIKYAFPDKFITVSNAIKDILVQDRIPEEKIAAVHSGVDLSIYNSIETDYLFEEFSNISELKNRVRLVNVAALTHQKDQETLIKAVSILIESNKNIALFIVGEGELESKLKKLVIDLDLEDYIHFTGFRDDTLSLIMFADIFILSSRWEGLGTSIIDAMAIGKPIIASRTGGIPELIRNEVNGILVEKESPEDLADAILRLINDKGMQKKISAEASNSSHHFSIQNTVDKTIEIYKEHCQ